MKALPWTAYDMDVELMDRPDRCRIEGDADVGSVVRNRQILKLSLFGKFVTLRFCCWKGRPISIVIQAVGVECRVPRHCEGHLPILALILYVIHACKVDKDCFAQKPKSE